MPRAASAGALAKPISYKVRSRLLVGIQKSGARKFCQFVSIMEDDDDDVKFQSIPLVGNGCLSYK